MGDLDIDLVKLQEDYSIFTLLYYMLSIKRKIVVPLPKVSEIFITSTKILIINRLYHK